jgi:hypothetical protein
MFAPALHQATGENSLGRTKSKLKAGAACPTPKLDFIHYWSLKK